MRPAAEDVPFTNLVQHWRQWTALLEKYARGKSSRRLVSAADYEKMHAGLLAACQGIEHADDERQRVFAAKVRQIVKPWVSLEAFKNEQMHSLFAVLARCADLERQMLTQPSPLDLSRWSVGMLASAVAVAVLGLFLVWFSFQPDAFESVSNPLRTMFIKVSNTIRWSSFIERFAVITIVAVLIGVRFAIRTARA